MLNTSIKWGRKKTNLLTSLLYMIFKSLLRARPWTEPWRQLVDTVSWNDARRTWPSPIHDWWTSKCGDTRASYHQGPSRRQGVPSSHLTRRVHLPPSSFLQLLCESHWDVGRPSSFYPFSNAEISTSTWDWVGGTLQNSRERRCLVRMRCIVQNDLGVGVQRGLLKQHHIFPPTAWKDKKRRLVEIT